MRAHHIAIQNRDLPAVFHQHDRQDVGDGALAGAGQAREPDAEALLVARRVGRTQDLGGFLAREPGRQQAALGQVIVAHLRARNGEYLAVGLDFGDLLVAVFVGQVDHLLVRQAFDANFVAVLLEQLAGGGGIVERLALGVLAGTGVVASHDEVVAAKIPADDGVPDGFPRAGHAHGQRQQAEQRGIRVVIILDQRFVDAHARVVVHVAGLGHADHRVEEQVGAGFLARRAW